MKLEFTDPPENRGRPESPFWRDVASALTARPGEWAKVPGEYYQSVVSHVRQGRLAAFQPAGSFEATGRTIKGTGKYTIYARYVGGQS
ncbi:hypothetical protein ACQCX2_07625 [Propionibacteriaceae bacterium Y1700]|uniref:hypothetical protein n=1 Tax=Microlunatus sp. Y1700 TaxID=3418487 RepID=UPI003DA761F9